MCGYRDFMYFNSTFGYELLNVDLGNVARAIHNVEKNFVFIGILEKDDKNLKVFKSLMNQSKLQSFSNFSHRRNLEDDIIHASTKAKITEHQINLIKQRSRADLYFYNYFYKKFEKTLKNIK